MEYMPREFARKLISLQSHIPFYQLRIGDELNENFDKIKNAKRTLKELPIYYVDDVSSIDDIEGKLHKIEQEKQIGCVVIDYLQLLGEEYQAKEDYSLIMLQIKKLREKMIIISFADHHLLIQTNYKALSSLNLFFYQRKHQNLLAPMIHPQENI